MEIKYEQPPIYKMAKEVADKAMDELEIDGKTLRQWIKEVEEYYIKKEQGKIVELPCKPGDTIYLLVNDGVNKPFIKEWKVLTIQCCVSLENKIGKTVFMTEQEAKEALEGMKE